MKLARMIWFAGAFWFWVAIVGSLIWGIATSQQVVITWKPLPADPPPASAPVSPGPPAGR
jgi:hypothetical protein